MLPCFSGLAFAARLSIWSAIVSRLSDNWVYIHTTAVVDAHPQIKCADAIGQHKSGQW